jgi:hypothetical protein
MTQYLQSVIAAIQTLWFLPESERTEYYDSVIAPAIDEIAASLVKKPESESLEGWLYIQSSTLDLAVEGITETTYELVRQFPKEFQEALSRLPTAQKARIQLLLREFEGQENLPPEIVYREEALTSSRIERLTDVLRNAPRSTTGVLGDFVGTSTLQSSRGFPIVHGTFTLFDRDGNEIDAYTVNSGGGSPNYRTRNGPVPPGVYRVSNHRPNRTTAGMVLNGVGYSFDIDPTDGTQVFGRSLFRIHPDGGNVGTNGCLGLRETAARLRECENTIVGLLEDGAFKVSVR